MVLERNEFYLRVALSNMTSIRDHFFPVVSQNSELAASVSRKNYNIFQGGGSMSVLLQSVENLLDEGFRVG